MTYWTPPQPGQQQPQGTFWHPPHIPAQNTTISQPCPACRGHKTMFVEGPAGQPQQEVPCPYCKGMGHGAWHYDNAVRSYTRAWRGHKLFQLFEYAFITVNWLMILSGAWNVGHTSPAYPWIPVVTWLCFPVSLIFVWAIIGGHRQRIRRERGYVANDGFTTTHEQVMGAAMLGTLAVKQQYDQRARRTQHSIDEINRKLPPGQG
jgi:hypothetical protein